MKIFKCIELMADFKGVTLSYRPYDTGISKDFSHKNLLNNFYSGIVEI